MKQLIKRNSTIILLGPGGVGKTTVTAALGIAAARDGLNTGMITVDPARRLRDALGLERLTAQPTRIDSRRLGAAGLDRRLKISAMMLDVKGAWNSLIERFVKSPPARQRILKNPFYLSLTENFAGAESYAALEQLYDLHTATRFDLQIVDTPPAAHAFEFLDAPAHLVRLLDSRAARWLFIPYAAASKAAAGIASRAARFVIGQLERFAGVRTLTSISEFFGAAVEAADAIADRFRKVEAMLHSSAVHFVLVTTAEEDRLSEALELVAQMEAGGLRLDAIVLNRMLDERTFDALRAAPRQMPEHLLEALALRGELNVADSGGQSSLDAVVHGLEDHVRDQRDEVARAVRFSRELPRRVELVIAPEIGTGVRNLKTIARVATILCETGAGRTLIEDAAVAFGLEEPLPRPRPPKRRATSR